MTASAQAAAATSAPASQPAPRKLVMPPGFKLMTVNGRNALFEPADEAWVTTALGKVAAKAKPATQPANYLQKLSEQRENIIRQMMTDLATNDPVPLAKGYDSDLTPQVRTLDNLHPPVFYLITTPERLSALMKGGWDDPRFYYNRTADAVTFNFYGMLSTDRPMDDLAFPIMFNPKDTPDKHGDEITAQITGFEANIAQQIDSRARVVLGTGLAQVVNNSTFEPLKPKEDQVWLGVGVASVLSAKYVAIITGEPRQNLVGALIYKSDKTLLKMSAIDLLHPTDIKSMVPQAVPAYLDTVRRKSCRAIEYLVEQAKGDAAIAKAVQALRDKKPADGAALVKAIKDATNVDLAPALTN